MDHLGSVDKAARREAGAQIRGVAHRLAAIALLAGCLAVSLAAVPDAKASSPRDTLGVYNGAGNVDGVDQFGEWLGHRLTRALEYVDGRSWSTIESPTWETGAWTGSGYRMDFSIPIIPDSGGSITTGASGAYNSHFVKLGQTLVAKGQADAIVRPGYEFNGNWVRWAASPNPGAWAAYFRQIVTSMRSVPGQDFEFEWNPSLGRVDVAPDQAYPGDQYVDYIGLDVYDKSWIANWEDPVARWNDFMDQPYGLRWHRDFAAQHGKPMTFPEWGLVSQPQGHGGGDNPYFIEQMYEWIRTNNVANHYYFEYDADGQHELMSGQFPNAAARFRELFGAESTDDPIEIPDDPIEVPDDPIEVPGAPIETPTETATEITEMPKRARPRIKGMVEGAKAGHITLEFQRRKGGRWMPAVTRRIRLVPSGQFQQWLRSIRRGRYRVRALYEGTAQARPSASAYRRFTV